MKTLSRMATVEEVIDEIYNTVDHLESVLIISD
jgi:hypothetical protein